MDRDDLRWLSLFDAYRAICLQEGVEPLDEDELAALLHLLVQDREPLPDARWLH